MKNDRALIFADPYNSHCVIHSNYVSKATIEHVVGQDKTMKSDVILSPGYKMESNLLKQTY